MRNKIQAVSVALVLLMAVTVALTVRSKARSVSQKPGQATRRPTPAPGAVSVPRDSLPICSGGFGPGSCEPGPVLCKQTMPTKVGGTLTLSDSSYSVRSDGRGPYVNGVERVNTVIGPVAALLLWSTAALGEPRYYSVDLNHPVPGDIGVPLGIIRETGIWTGPVVEGTGYGSEIAAQWYTEPNFTQHTMQEIPIHSTVFAEQLDISLHINGLQYFLQMGPQPVGHCFFEKGNAIFGTGTTRATITRESDTRWVVDLPAGSIGRLFEDSRGDDSHAVNKGLYYVSLHYVIQQ